MSTPFTARLPDATVSAIKALVESGRFKSQAKVIVAAVESLSGNPVPVVPAQPSAPTPKAQKPATAKESVPLANVAPPPTPPKPAAVELARHPNEAQLGRRANAQPFSRDVQRHS